MNQNITELKDIVKQQGILIEHLITRDNPAEAAESVTALLPKPAETMEEFEALEKKCCEEKEI